MRTLDKNTIGLFMGTLFLLVGLAFFAPKSYAAVSISCQTAYGEKEFTIDENSVAMHKEVKSQRAVASVHNVNTIATHKGFKKVVYIDGNKHQINIEDAKNFNETNDYLAITNPKGHKMTYPLTCHNT
jgi:hypothetical protein